MREHFSFSNFAEELVASLLLGGIPTIWVFIYDGADGLLIFMKAIDTSDFTVYLFLSLLLLQVAVTFAGYYAPRHYDQVKQITRVSYRIVNRAGTSLLSLYRFICGICIGCGLAGISYFPYWGELAYSVIFFAIAGVIAIVCVFFDALNQVLNAKQY